MGLVFTGHDGKYVDNSVDPDFILFERQSVLAPLEPKRSQEITGSNEEFQKENNILMTVDNFLRPFKRH
jgi:hypothetical protein